MLDARANGARRLVGDSICRCRTRPYQSVLRWILHHEALFQAHFLAKGYQKIARLQKHFRLLCHPCLGSWLRNFHLLRSRFCGKTLKALFQGGFFLPQEAFLRFVPIPLSYVYFKAVKFQPLGFSMSWSLSFFFQKKKGPKAQGKLNWTEPGVGFQNSRRWVAKLDVCIGQQDNLRLLFSLYHSMVLPEEDRNRPS